MTRGTQMGDPIRLRDPPRGRLQRIDDERLHRATKKITDRDADALRMHADRAHRDRDAVAEDETAGDRQHPRGDDASRYTPAHGGEATRGADAEDRAGDGVRRGDGNAETRRDLDHGA